jgi:hypothetical protein
LIEVQEKLVRNDLEERAIEEFIRPAAGIER